MVSAVASTKLILNREHRKFVEGLDELGVTALDAKHGERVILRDHCRQRRGCSTPVSCSGVQALVSTDTRVIEGGEGKE